MESQTYLAAVETYWQKSRRMEGFCTTCSDWTRECTEPDAEDYDCPACGEYSVVGAEVWAAQNEL